VSGSAALGALLPRLPVRPPGPASRALAERLRAVESRNVTFLSEDWPIFWEEAAGSNVRDADGNVYVDLTGGFGVALLGHSHPAVVEAVRSQVGRLIHAMGDVHPPALKVELLEALASICPWEGARGVLASTGSEAVEIGLKTAQLATGRAGVLAFEGAYHGLTLGSLAATSRQHRTGIPSARSSSSRFKVGPARGSHLPASWRSFRISRRTPVCSSSPTRC
jgi:4-aminobutyrate aminotransferase-like enzyme